MANNEQNTGKIQNDSQTVEVLYQKMGNRWFAFSLIDEEVFVGSITQDEIDGNEPLLAAEPSSRGRAPGQGHGMNSNS